MKIIIIPNMPAFSGRHLDIANNLIKQGHDVNYFHWELPYGVSLKNIWRHLITSLSVKNYKLEKLEIHKVIRLPYFWPVINGWIFKWQLRKLFKKLDADIIITESYTNETEVPKDLPFIYDLADDYAAPADVYGSPIYKLAFKLLGVKKVMKRQCQNALAVTAVSDILVKYASKYNKNVYKLPNGVDTEIIKKIKKAKNINPHSMIYVTGFGKWSRAIETLEAVVKLKKVFPRLELTLAGSGIESENMKKFIYKNNAENYIHYLGFINDRKKVFGLINSHAIGLNISDKNKWRDAAHPIKVIEYSSFGKKVVSTDLDEVNNLKYPNLFIFSDKSKNNNLINTLRRALIDTRTDKEFSNASEKVLTKYDWKKITSNLLDIVKKHKKETVNNKRRIVHVTPSYPPALGGLENVVQSLAREQYKSGEYVEVITTKADKKLKVDSEGFPVTRLSSWTFANTQITPGLFIKIFKFNKYDILHLHIVQAFMPEVVFLISKIRKYKIVCHIHLDIQASGALGIFLNHYKKYILKKVLINSHKIVVPTSDYKLIIAKKYNIPLREIVVIPNGTYHKIKKAIKTPTNEKLRLLFVGRLSYQKNLSFLLNNINYYAKKYSTNFNFKIVGNGPKKSELNNIISELKLKKLVSIEGPFVGRKLEKIYAESDIFLLSSTHESFGIVLIEAMTKGLPIISTNIIGVRNIIKNRSNGLLVKNYKYDFAKSINYLSQNKQLYSSISKNNLAEAEKYRWEYINYQFINLYKNII